MKYRLYGTAVKGAAFILFLISVVTAFWSLLGVGYMVNDRYYWGGYAFINTELCEKVSRVYADEAFYDYFRLAQKTNLQPDEKTALDYYKTMLSNDKTNFIFKITDGSGSVVLSNDDGNANVYQRTYMYSGSGDLPDVTYTLSYSVRDPLTVSDEYSQPYHIFRTLYQARYDLIALAAIASVVSLGLFVYLMFASGRRAGRDEVVATWQHKIPVDLFAAALVFIAYLVLRAMETFNLPGNSEYGFLIMLPVSIVLLFFSFVALVFCMNLAVQVKRGTWWRATVVCRILSFAGRTIAALFRRLPLIWKSALLLAGYLFVNVLLTGIFIMRGSPGGVFVWLLFNLAVFAALCFLLLQMKTLGCAGRQLASGDYSGKIDTKKMVWDFKQHAENLNNIGNGMTLAVEARLKSERLKTELITNVSHDLKTPLTSIINYIDLLKREPIQNETVGDYIAVLERQSMRLKKLTEDLLEASKAATGNVKVNFERTDLVELLNQSVGEYSERFEGSKLEAVFQANSETADINADGKLLWRVFDNLLNNICKYSLAGTRVYITVAAGAGRTTVTLMNISRDPLNIAPEELQERFVRGDASRSTEGSGLGLAIARSLTELLGGSFELRLEGDLFKTVLTFQTMP